MRKKIDITGSTIELIALLSEGNPGAMNVMCNLPDDTSVNMLGRLGLLLDLDDMNIRGSQIWVGYKDHCGQDMDKFAKCLQDRDKAMVDAINAEGSSREVAVCHGAS